MLRFSTSGLEPYRDPAYFREALFRLPWPEKRERIVRYRQEDDRIRGLAAWTLAAEMLRAEGVRDLQLDHTQAGKPYLRYYTDLHFNLSHGGELAVCAVSDRPVGADAEPLLFPDPDIAAFAFSGEERRWLAEQAEADASPAFTRLWVRKESYLKCLGTGLSYPLRELTLHPGRETEQGCRFTEKESRGHRISVCCQI
ncbi:MAG: 4'-phosphopantetheinyl transferase superfamily protein [Lachnospiraceae bacterium]|nr:4'-phosphopantetheinyl transferase superfamily protein [Lachnospiraceae bacterium]